MRFTCLALLISVFSPLAIYASHIPLRRQLPTAPPPGTPTPPAPFPPPAGAPTPPTPPAPPGPVSNASGAPPVGAAGGAAKVLPVNSLPPAHPRRAHVDQHRREFRNADFVSSGPLPSSNIDSVAASDDEGHLTPS